MPVDIRNLKPMPRDDGGPTWRYIADQLKPQQIAELECYEDDPDSSNEVAAMVAAMRFLSNNDDIDIELILYWIARDYAQTNMVEIVHYDEIMADLAEVTAQDWRRLATLTDYPGVRDICLQSAALAEAEARNYRAGIGETTHD